MCLYSRRRYNIIQNTFVYDDHIIIVGDESGGLYFYRLKERITNDSNKYRISSIENMSNISII